MKTDISDKIIWSHSRLNTLMSNPAEYYLSYVQGIKPKLTKSALSLGSAVHYGLEIESDDLTEYYKNSASTTKQDNYSDEQLLAESMCGAYFKRKDEIYKDLLKDLETNEQLNIIDEQHELELVAKLKSLRYNDFHSFMGIIDLLLLTNKGWILVDYKTSSLIPDWEKYKSQLFKYKLLLEQNFPGISLYKVAIINLRKTQIRRKKNENDDNFRMRLKNQYEIDDLLIGYHIYEGKEFDDNTLSNYLNNLIGLIDASQMIIDNNNYFTNYSNIIGTYGPSQYAEIFYNEPENYLLYTIHDTIFDEFDNKILKDRDCVPIDMQVLDHKNIMNKYSLFKEEAIKVFKDLDNIDFNKIDINPFLNDLKNKYICDDNLLNKYYINLCHKI